MQIWPLLRMWGCPSKKAERFSLLFCGILWRSPYSFQWKVRLVGLGSLPVARVVAEHAMDIAAVNISTCSFTLILMLIWMSQCFVKMNISTIFTWHPEIEELPRRALYATKNRLWLNKAFFSAMDVHSSEVGWWLLARYCLGVQADWLKKSQSQR